MEHTARWALDELPSLWSWRASAFAELFSRCVYPWDALTLMDEWLAARLDEEGGGFIQSALPEGVHLEGPVHIGRDCHIEPGVFIRGPAWIDDECELRTGCYLRGSVLAGAGCVLGHASEFKHCILLEHAQAPHFDYVGDSVLGAGAHVGAGVVLSNYRLDGRPVAVHLPQADGQVLRIETGLPKFGALLGDLCEVGCNTVLNPGTIVGEKSTVLPLALVSGVWPAGSRIMPTLPLLPGIKAQS
ncbi:MAG: hypothetical protein QHH01_00400 [Spirochaetales bacterium]|nr:hypothetical protein [Spirochaetales bacterium]